MNNLIKILLGGVALSTLTAAPAMADTVSGFHFTQLHGGRVVSKTKMPNHGATHITYTFGVYDYLPASTPLHITTRFPATRFCWAPKKITVTPKKTEYAKVGYYTETYSNGCELVGATYKLFKQPNPGDTDSFKLSITGKFEQKGTKYKGTLNLDYDIDFE